MPLRLSDDNPTFTPFLITAKNIFANFNTPSLNTYCQIDADYRHKRLHNEFNRGLPHSKPTVKLTSAVIPPPFLVGRMSGLIPLGGTATSFMDG
jgi:hypothetical protein